MSKDNFFKFSFFFTLFLILGVFYSNIKRPALTHREKPSLTLPDRSETQKGIQEKIEKKSVDKSKIKQLIEE
ncbi:MAG: hypothetical protein KKD55_03245, partial [Candidatus Omnitrophica bacterium]|nr:hypothetical protein [Candidatus Omnitrophota bacterium]